ncbi:hypothetical protein SAMN05518683_10233 [Salibacterium halotolerans]|uniref:Uncharacterized protein n=2 Tax=Salibacterium halotolerans TaxID=1884432 RepID=A0A1I5LZF3_9BACI|nr:hypothetical protein SAMN05518683_10233 [Salibacterium halotolerans]
MQTLKRTDAEERIAVLRMEIDYELAGLYDAMVEGNIDKSSEYKESLEQLRLELIRLEA